MRQRKYKRYGRRRNRHVSVVAVRSGKTRWMVLLLVIVVLTVSGLVLSQKINSSDVSDAGGTFTVRKGDLTITVSEGGSIRAHKSVEYRCQVESRGMSSGITILSIVPAGTYVTQEDVNDGRVLVKLDSSALEDRLTSDELELNSDNENATAAQESYDIQVKQNESDIAAAGMRVRFALMDLQKYLGKDLAGRLVANAKDVSNLTEYIAPFIRDMQDDPNYLDSSSGAGQELKRLNDAITLAEGNLKTAEDTLTGTQKLFDANYVSFLDLQRDQLNVKNSTFNAENARVTLELFLKYDFPKGAEQYLSDYIEAGRDSDRTQAQCRSRLAQAQVRLSSAKERLSRQQRQVDELNQQIEYCTIRAKAPGLVVYGTGSTEDAFRAMRGRGGGGSGIIAEGETVSENQVLISMPDTASMVAEISVHETEVDKVSPGQPAEIIMDAFPDKVLQGRVLEVAPLPDQQRGWMNPDLKVYKTLVNIEGSHEFLKSRMSCRVEILVQKLKDVLLVPIQVVSNSRGGKVCHVLTPDGVKEQEVQTGAFNDTFVQITEGLKEGDEVLLNPPLYTETGGDAVFQDRGTGRFENVSQESPPTTSTEAGTSSGQGSRRGRSDDGGQRAYRQKDPNGMGQGGEEGRQGRRGRSGGFGQGGFPGGGFGGNMTDEQRQQMRQRMQEFQNMSPEERQQRMQQFQNMTPEERQQRMQQFMQRDGQQGEPTEPKTQDN